MLNQENQFELIGKQICSKEGFKLIQKVGEGGFKYTYQIKNKSGQDCALKVFKTSISNRLEREIYAMQKCDHPNIARILSFNSIEINGEDYFYITEEFFFGGTLTETLKKGILGIERTIRIGEYLIDAISHISNRNIVHRDIKPDNILFKDDDYPILTDFGIARILDQKSITKTWFSRGPGTPFFAAPEQLNNQKCLIDWRTDQFSCGVVLTLCVIGIHPYQKNDDTVENVALRGKMNLLFLQNIEKEGLFALKKMVEPWPIQRYLNPTILKAAWVNQRRN